MGAAWAQDAYTQSELCLYALKLAAEFLAPEGSAVFVFGSNRHHLFDVCGFFYPLARSFVLVRHIHYKDLPVARL